VESIDFPLPVIKAVHEINRSPNGYVALRLEKDFRNLIYEQINTE
jgi:hypothetical protein